MTDIHCHIIPETDDGAVDWDTALGMLHAAKADDIDTIVASSHYSSDSFAGYHDRFERLRAEAGALGIRLLKGCEYDLSILSTIPPEQVIPLGESKYLLVDLNQNFVPPSLLDLFFKFRLANYQIIFAHPERMVSGDALLRLVDMLIDHQIFIQVNSGSITGRYGKETRKNALQILDRGCCHLIANDAHRSSHFLFGHCRQKLLQRYPASSVDWWLKRNPENLFAGKPLFLPPKRRGILSRWLGLE